MSAWWIWHGVPVLAVVVGALLFLVGLATGAIKEETQ